MNSTKEYLLAGATLIRALGKTIITGGHSAAGDYYYGRRFQEHWERAQYCRACESLERQKKEASKGPEL